VGALKDIGNRLGEEDVQTRLSLSDTVTRLRFIRPLKDH
jgi:hypothetical protein